MSFIFLFILGFVVVILGANLLVGGACSFAKRLRVSELVIGLTVVAFGTSLPELFVNITASIKGDAGIVLGNIFGSNIANIFLILGISGVIFPLAVTRGTVWKEIPLSLLAAVLVGILANDHLIDGTDSSALSRIDGLVLISFFIVFLFYSAGVAREAKSVEKDVFAKRVWQPQAKPGDGHPHPDKKNLDEAATHRIIFSIVIGLLGLIIGSNLVVGGASGLAGMLGVSQSLIGLTIVAVGTSLPELATSAVAAYRKNPDIAVGNVVGSNIFNIFFILGTSAIIRPIPFKPEDNINIGVVILASLLLFLCMFTGKRRILDRWESIVFLVLYVVYIGFMIVRK